MVQYEEETDTTLCTLFRGCLKDGPYVRPTPPNRENSGGNYNKVKLYMPENVEENRQKNKGTETKKKIRRTEKEEQEEGQKGNYSNKEGEQTSVISTGQSGRPWGLCMPVHSPPNKASTQLQHQKHPMLPQRCTHTHFYNNILPFL